MYKLEHGSEDKSILKNRVPGLKQIEALQLNKKDDYLLNKLARNKFRVSIRYREFNALYTQLA